MRIPSRYKDRSVRGVISQMIGVGSPLRVPSICLHPSSLPSTLTTSALQSWQTNRAARGKHSGRYLFLLLGGSLLARGLLWYSAKLKNILGDFGNRPGFWSKTLHGHIGFHDLATHWPQ